MRYNQDSHTTPLSIESSTQPSPILSLYPPGQPPVFNQTTSYQPEGIGALYPSSSNIFPNLDVRPRIGTTNNTTSNSNSSNSSNSNNNNNNNNSQAGMAQAHWAQLPNPAAQISTRDIYSSATPSFRRAGEHSTRSPSFPGNIRRRPLSPTPSPNQVYSAPFKMDSNALGPKSLQNIPPLMDITTFGTLQYADGTVAGTPAKIEINGTIDKGFFLADNEWTCYRRNYFSCVCSFGLTPFYQNSNFTFTPNGSTRGIPVRGFAMSISAVVSDNDTHVIELVQHTPKRDKGPTARPEKVRLNAKPPHPAHPSVGLYTPDGGMSVPVPGRFEGYGPSPAGCPTEHTFERIQFKQATANNGKRRAAQQYYHLIVELWAELNSSMEQHVKIAQRKSAKMIVRGRSPGHYQSERRESASSGPGGSAGSLGYGGSQVMGSDLGSTGSVMLQAPYSTAYDPRSASHYGDGARHHEQSTPHHQQQHSMAIDPPVMSADEVKSISETKDYQYYPATICDSSHDPRQPVEMFTHAQRNDHDTVLPHMNASGLDSLSKIKQETAQEAPGPHMFYAGESFYTNRCGRFEGKNGSSGYYPTMIPPASSSISMS